MAVCKLRPASTLTHLIILNTLFKWRHQGTTSRLDIFENLVHFETSDDHVQEVVVRQQ